ncbi:MAG: hypothetical protein SAK29_28825 [Scytonema sp. PMC 1069.18]|nr:hypothetical protein [Scytonema sp. PMC 1069.18]MEC4881098.1 hypothetical protein [Scytonema sp. PMC 1070.18]
MIGLNLKRSPTHLQNVPTVTLTNSQDCDGLSVTRGDRMTQILKTRKLVPDKRVVHLLTFADAFVLRLPLVGVPSSPSALRLTTNGYIHKCDRTSSTAAQGKSQLNHTCGYTKVRSGGCDHPYHVPIVPLKPTVKIVLAMGGV